MIFLKQYIEYKNSRIVHQRYSTISYNVSYI